MTAAARSSTLLMSGLLCLTASPSLLADWRLSKGVVAVADAVDNADFSDGDPSEGAARVSLAPYLTLDGTGRRSELALSGRLELVRDDEGSTDIAPEIAVATRTELLARRASFDADARVVQRAVDDDLFDTADLRRVDEAEEIYEIGLGPTVEDMLGDHVRYRAGYRFTATRGSDEELVGSDVHALTLDTLVLFGNSDAALLVDMEHDVARFENDESARYAQGRVGVAWPFTRSLSGAAQVGRDWLRLDDADAETSTVWNVELRWRPSERLSATVGYGERAFGARPNASIEWTRRRSSIALEWSRDLAFVDPRTRVADDEFELGGDRDTEASPTVEDEFTDPIDGEPSAAFARNLSAVDERVALTGQLQGRRSTLSATFGWFERDDLVDERVLRGSELGMSLERALSRTTALTVGWTGRSQRATGDPQQSRSNRVVLSLSVEL